MGIDTLFPNQIS